jgi:hypothetical protein
MRGGSLLCKCFFQEQLDFRECKQEDSIEQ